MTVITCVRYSVILCMPGHCLPVSVILSCCDQDTVFLRPLYCHAVTSVHCLPVPLYCHAVTWTLYASLLRTDEISYGQNPVTGTLSASSLRTPGLSVIRLFSSPTNHQTDSGSSGYSYPSHACKSPLSYCSCALITPECTSDPSLPPKGE